jgi:hypothetical protein
VKFTFAGYPCSPPDRVLEACRSNGLPTAWWWDDVDCRPNSWRNVLGCQSGRGFVLMLRRDVDLIDQAASHELYMQPSEPKRGGLPLPPAEYAVTHYALHMVRYDVVTPGHDGQPEAVCLVELADKRRLLRQRTLNAAYNVRHRSGDGYFADTTDGGTAWTWQDLLAEIWGALGVEDELPTLPFAPHGTPENFNFFGPTRALDALCVVLSRLGCDLALDTQDDSYHFVRLGELDADMEEKLGALYPGFKEHDRAPYLPPLGRVAAKVAVHFPEYRQVAPDAPPGWYVVEVTGTELQAAGAEAGSIEPIADDMAALYDAADALSNAAALAARAQERADDYYRVAMAEPRRAVYALSHPTLYPGAAADAVRWGDRGRGLVTEVESAPRGPAMLSPEEQPDLGGGGGAGAGTSCCDLAALSNIDCVLVTYGEVEVILAKSGDVWTSADVIDYPLGSGVFSFWFEGGTCHLSLNALELINCGDGCFRAGPITGHTAQRVLPELACSGDTFEVCVVCRCCFPEGWYCVDNGDGCPGEALYLMDADVCELEASICSGPYDSEAEALAVCPVVVPPPGDQEITCDEIPTTLPGVYTLTWSTAVGMPGHPATISTCDMTYQAGLSTPVTGPLVWQGTMTGVTIAANDPCTGCGPHDFLIQQRVRCVEGEIPGSFQLIYETRSSCDDGATWDAWSTLGASGNDTNNGWAVGDPGFAPGISGGGCGDCCAIWWSNDAVP